jgi:integrase/recombinase XerD
VFYLKKYLVWQDKEIQSQTSKLEKVVVEQFIQHLSSKHTLKSINDYINSLVSYNKFLISEGIQDDMVVTSDLKAPKEKLSKKFLKNQKEILKENCVEDLLMEVCSEDSIKNSTMLSLAAYAGLRAEEIVELSPEDINFDKRKIYVRGLYKREIPMNSKLESALKLYLREEEIGTLLFTNERRGKFTKEGLQWILRKNRVNSHITMFALRNFYRAKLSSQGYSSKEIDELMGYSTYKKDYTSKKIKEMLTVKQFAGLVNSSPSTVINWCNDKKIISYRNSWGQRRIPFSEVEKASYLRVRKSKGSE